MDIYPAAAEVIRDVPVDQPVLCLRPHAATRAARWFLEHFPGETLYAVKANNSPLIIGALFDAGIRHYDVASVTELRTIGALPGAEMHVMHPVKPRRLIAEAYYDFGVRTFALDSEAELEKIEAVTGGAKDLTLVVRVACPSTYSEISLEGKFGAPWSEAPALIRRARQTAELAWRLLPWRLANDVHGRLRPGAAHHFAADRTCGYARRYHRRWRRLPFDLSGHGAAGA